MVTATRFSMANICAGVVKVVLKELRCGLGDAENAVVCIRSILFSNETLMISFLYRLS